MIVGWLGSKDLEEMGFRHYTGENRDVAEVRLKDLRPMKSLFEFIE